MALATPPALEHFDINDTRNTIDSSAYFMESLALLSLEFDHDHQHDMKESMDVDLPTVANHCLVSKQNVYKQYQHQISPAFATPSAQTLIKKKTNRFCKSQTFDVIQNTESSSIHTPKKYNPFSNANEATATINFDQIETEQLKYKNGQKQRNILDSNIENMDETHTLKWSKYCVRTGKTLNRNVEIRIVKTFTTIHGHHMGAELPLDKIWNITKSWITDQKTQFVADILNIFNVNETETSFLVQKALERGCHILLYTQRRE
eukprot:287352_1